MGQVAFVVAIAENGVIGRDGALPWRIAADMAHFKRVTMGKPIVMGRKTWDSLPRKPLPGRANIVVTRDQSYEALGAEVAHEARAALLLADKHLAQSDESEICVIGGAQIYDALLPMVDRIYLTEIHAAIEGDASFIFDKAAWREVSRERHEAGDKDSADYSFVVFERI